MNCGDAGSDLLFERSDDRTAHPKLTIAVPTFNRPHLLIETLESIWIQREFDNYDVIVVDNASELENVAIVRRFLELSGRPVRYYRNHANVGVFRNWNRCLRLARGEWVSVLNDDDLLKPGFFKAMMLQIGRTPQVEALICRAELLDQRNDEVRSDSRAMALKARILTSLRFTGRSVIRLTVRRLFWSNIAGSSLGALYHRDTVMKIGGFDPDEAPIADYVLNVRLAARGRFFQTPEHLVQVRLQVNESMKPETLRGVLIGNFRLRCRLVAAGLVPHRWKNWPRHLLSHEMGAADAYWRQSPARGEIARALSINPPAVRARWMYLIRVLNGGV